jgi:SAM-dependent methyltransferase
MSNRTVNSEMYDRNYFIEKINTKIDSLLLVDSNIYKTMIDLVGPSMAKDKVLVDFGCGTGILSFLLNNKFNCKVIGIDYSQAAIDLCEEHKKSLKLDDIEFKCESIDSLQNIGPVDFVLFSDVIEHLYEEEIISLLEKMRMWNKDSNISQYLIIHTDNNNYLRYIRIFIDFLSIVSLRNSLKEIKERNMFENERHVNLKSPSKLDKTMIGCGYKLVEICYPKIDKERLRAQIGVLYSIPLFPQLLIAIYPLIKKLSPSFYAKYELVLN